MPYPISQISVSSTVIAIVSFEILSHYRSKRSLEMHRSEELGDYAVLGGGEPMLHPKLPAILKGLRQQKVNKVAIRTNAAWAANPKLPPPSNVEGSVMPMY